MKRRDFLLGALVGLAGGAGLEYFVASLPPARLSTLPLPPETRKILDTLKKGRLSVAQQGEDLIIKNIFDMLMIEKPSYLDIGAHDPIIGNNTYLLYSFGSRGVLVEPNPFYCERIRRERPGDKVLNVGVGITDEKAADYYVIEGRDQLNTFDPEQVEIYKKRGDRVQEVLKMPLVNINDLIAEHFDHAPDLISIDVEGLDLAILKTLDFEHFRPLVICAETLDFATKGVRQEILDFVTGKDYSVRGGTLVNTVFVDNRLLRKWVEIGRKELAGPDAGTR